MTPFWWVMIGIVVGGGTMHALWQVPYTKMVKELEENRKKRPVRFTD